MRMRSRRWTGSSGTVVERRSSSTVGGSLRTAIVADVRPGESSIGRQTQGQGHGFRLADHGQVHLSRTPPAAVLSGTLSVNRYDVETSRSGGTAYAAVSNTAPRKWLRVRIPPSAPSPGRRLSSAHAQARLAVHRLPDQLAPCGPPGS